MPSLGADMDSGIVLEWRVKPGDRVKRGDIVAVVDTSKADIEIEVFEDGTIDELLVPVGTRVQVGTPIARLADGASPPSANGGGPPPEAERRRISPVARRTAAELGVDLDAVKGTGPLGAVVKADVERAAGNGAPVPPPTPPETRPAEPEGDRAEAMRAAIAHLMARSKREVPHYYLREDVDMSAALSFLERRNAELPVARRLLPAALLLKATALALADVPELNGFWNDGRFEQATGIHLGLAVSLRGGGLVAPALHDTGRRSLEELMESMRDLVRRARAGTLRSSEMSDPTLTVTNLGERGALEVYGVIYPPQVALVGFGRIAERPWAAGGMLAARPVTTATLSGDHRASDGVTGGRLLAAIAAKLQRPEEL
ncbi:MAG: 2-oxo acid dehydrogenase subunit E2 [Thermoleophilaceae bacterium]|nr:2-oxo acid dehydrogenase subunit E2 [Thermoleophilaceae bacterium]